MASEQERKKDLQEVAELSANDEVPYLWNIEVAIETQRSLVRIVSLNHCISFELTEGGRKA